MGCYVNSPDMTKEEWLVKNGESTLKPCDITAIYVPVCLVQNVAFSAAGVGYCKREVVEFERDDGRDKRWYKVERAKLREVSDLANWEQRHPPSDFPPS